jgi:alkylated DNA repair dioxygenase AlkB
MIKSPTILPINFDYISDFLKDADIVFEKLFHELNRKSYPITMFGKKMVQPRLVSFYADTEVSYTYSQTILHGDGWHPLLQYIKQSIIDKYPEAHTINSVLCNLYRNGQDSMGWHADDEKEL